jgi:preprotein translocase subunit SecF
LLVLLALFVFGGEAIHGFSIALIVGVLVGTYSSIYIASPTALALDVSATDLMPPQKDDSEIDALP